MKNIFVVLAFYINLIGYSQVVLWEELSSKEKKKVTMLQQKLNENKISTYLFDNKIITSSNLPPKRIHSDDKSIHLLSRIQTKEAELLQWILPQNLEDFDWKNFFSSFPQKTIFILYNFYPQNTSVIQNLNRDMISGRTIILYHEIPS